MVACAVLSRKTGDTDQGEQWGRTGAVFGSRRYSYARHQSLAKVIALGLFGSYNSSISSIGGRNSNWPRPMISPEDAGAVNEIFDKWFWGRVSGLTGSVGFVPAGGGGARCGSVSAAS